MPAGTELNYENGEVIGYDVLDFIHEEDQPSMLKNYELLLVKEHTVATYCVYRKDGEYIWFESSLRKLHDVQLDETKIYVISRVQFNKSGWRKCVVFFYPIFISINDLVGVGR